MTNQNFGRFLLQETGKNANSRLVDYQIHLNEGPFDENCFFLSSFSSDWPPLHHHFVKLYALIKYISLSNSENIDILIAYSTFIVKKRILPKPLLIVPSSNDKLGPFKYFLNRCSIPVIFKSLQLLRPIASTSLISFSWKKLRDGIAMS